MGWMKGTLRLFGPSIVVGLAAPFVFPGLRRSLRPVMEGVVKGGLALSESFKEAAADAREQMSDLLAKVRAEREQEALDAASEKRDKA
jgi:Protein of unknown function (DUF5132)